jgi:hypothetical protein
MRAVFAFFLPSSASRAFSPSVFLQSLTLVVALGNTTSPAGIARREHLPRQWQAVKLAACGKSWQVCDVLGGRVADFFLLLVEQVFSRRHCTSKRVGRRVHMMIVCCPMSFKICPQAGVLCCCVSVLLMFWHVECVLQNVLHTQPSMSVVFAQVELRLGSATTHLRSSALGLCTVRQFLTTAMTKDVNSIGERTTQHHRSTSQEWLVTANP